MVAIACRQCGTPAGLVRDVLSALRAAVRRAAPSRRRVPSCHVCYQTVEDDGRLPSLDAPGLRVDLHRHLAEHDRHPVGDDEWLESLRLGDRVRIEALVGAVRRCPSLPRDRRGRGWTTPGVRAQHDRDGDDPAQAVGHGATILGDQPEWQAARAAVSELMERYHLRRR